MTVHCSIDEYKGVQKRERMDKRKTNNDTYHTTTGAEKLEMFGNHFKLAAITKEQ